MFKLITMIIPFIKELFFDRKEEMDFKSPHFNIKKWGRYIIFLVSLLLLTFMGERLISLTTSYIKLETVNIALSGDNTTLKHKLSETQEALAKTLADQSGLIRECDAIKSMCNPGFLKKDQSSKDTNRNTNGKKY